jgi:hypothetical protein
VIWSGDFSTDKVFRNLFPGRLLHKSGAKATAVQTLRAVRNRWLVAERLDCGGSPPFFHGQLKSNL